jgi:hypothetical protein
MTRHLVRIRNIIELPVVTLLLLLLLLCLTMLQLLLMKLTALVMCSMPVARYSSLHSTTRVDARQQHPQQQHWRRS